MKFAMDAAIVGIVVSVGLALRMAIREYQIQNDQILRLHAESQIEHGFVRTRYRCPACKFPFVADTAYLVECPNCRGLVRIRLPRG